MKFRRSMVLWFFVGAAGSASWLAWSRAPHLETHPADPNSAPAAKHVVRVPDEITSTDHNKIAFAALEIVNGEERRVEISEALALWAQEDGAAALAWAESAVPEKELPKVLFDALAEWIVQDTDAMLQWYIEGLNKHGVHRIDVECPRPYVIGEQVVAWLALLDPVRAANFLYHDIYQDGETGPRSFMQYSETGNDLASALKTGDDFREVCEAFLPYYEKHGRHLGETNEILRKWRAIDSKGAAEFIENYPRAVQRPIQDPARVIKESVPENTLENADRLIGEIGENRDQYGDILTTILGNWPKDDLTRAVDWLTEQGTSEKTLEGRSILAARLVESDPAAALDLLQPMPEGEGLEKATERVVERWASLSLQDTLAFLRGQQSTWTEEKIDRLRELALTAP